MLIRVSERHGYVDASRRAGTRRLVVPGMKTFRFFDPGGDVAVSERRLPRWGKRGRSRLSHGAQRTPLSDACCGAKQNRRRRRLPQSLFWTEPHGGSSRRRLPIQTREQHPFALTPVPVAHVIPAQTDIQHFNVRGLDSRLRGNDPRHIGSSFGICGSMSRRTGGGWG